MWEYNYTNTLCHYGVKGMKWGVRRATKYQNKARIARGSADEWDEMARYAEQKGKHKRAAQYRNAAAKDRADADTYDRKAANATKPKTPLTPEQKKARGKKIATGILVGLGAAAVTAGAIYYAKNKGKVDAAVGKVLANAKKSVKKTVKKINPTTNKTKAANKRIKKFALNATSKSSEEVKAQLEYLKNVKAVQSLSSEVVNPGRAAVTKILTTAGTSAATTMVTGGILYGTKVAVTKKADRKDAMDYITPKPKKK